MTKLKDYRRKRRFEATPEPAGKGASTSHRKLPRFVVQQHHATSLHWDFRLERDGVLVSWAVPKGIPADPKTNHLAVHVEDHPLEYIDFAGEIPEGNYGAGKVTIWDQGVYEAEKWTDREVKVVLQGTRLSGRYVLFQTRGKNWMIHRMDPPQDPGREPFPEAIEPMKAALAAGPPRDEEQWAFEFKWDGVRAVIYNQGGRVRVLSRSLEDITDRYPELRGIGEQLGAIEAVVDGEVIAVDESGRPSFERLQQRMGLTSEGDVRRRMKTTPVFFMAFDVLYLDGRSTMDRPYAARRSLLEGLGMKGDYWQTPPASEDHASVMIEASRRAGMEGVVAKRLDSRYFPGRRSDVWLKIKNKQRQELVIGGWLEGEGSRSGRIGALLLGYYDGGRLVYAGKCGTGFTDKTLDQLAALLKPIARQPSPFAVGAPPRGSHFVEPSLVGEFEFTEWTKVGQLRHPSFKGLRDDKDPGSVTREAIVS